MLERAVFPGKYIQGAGALGELPGLVKLFGRQGLILASPTVYKKILPESGIDVSGHSLLVEGFAGECCERELSRLDALIREKQVDVLVGMGGGKTIDTAKIAADRANIPVFVVPTIASTDAPAADAPCCIPRVAFLNRCSIKRQIRQPSWWIRKSSPVPRSVFSWRAWAMLWRRGSRQSPASVRSPKTSAADSAR